MLQAPGQPYCLAWEQQLGTADLRSLQNWYTISGNVQPVTALSPKFLNLLSRMVSSSAVDLCMHEFD